MSAVVELAGQRLELLAERAVWWPARRALLLADVHLGKDQVFRRAGIAVPAGVLADDLARIDALIARTRAERLIVLGDWVHAPPNHADDWPELIARWRRRPQAPGIDLILGNHDRALEAWMERWRIQAHRRLDLDGLCLVHEWTDAAADAGMSGHLHPGAVLKDGRQRLRLPAFLMSRDHLVLPAFGRFTGLMVEPDFPTEQAWVIAGDRVLPLPTAALAANRA